MLDFLKSLIITPISYLWEQIYIIRRFLYKYGFFKVHSYSFPVFSVGNITFGGTGKTPFTIWLTNYLTKKSLRPVVLTRGYKGKFENSMGVLEAKRSFRYNPVDYGDEPLLISRRLKEGAVVVGKNRRANLDFLEKKLSPDVCILDDGFQHLKIDRNLNICLFDALLPISQYEVAPKGYLREGKTALEDADILVISRADQVSNQKINELKKAMKPFVNHRAIWATIRYQTLGVFNANYERVGDSSLVAGKNIIAIAAVANPTSFYSMIEGLGGNIVERLSYPDHYYFTLEDIEKFIRLSEEKSAMVLTSEKDIVKMRKISTEMDVYYLEISVEFISGEDRVIELISKNLY